MNNINHISIPKPCHQPWNNMAENNNGRFCSNCSTTVIDFSVMSNQQIIDHLYNAGKVCGRFDEQQFNTLNRNLQTDNLQVSGFWKRMILAATLLTASQHVKAQTLPATRAIEQGPSNFILGKIVKADAIKYKTVSGCVTDADDKSPLPAVTIKVSGETIGTMIDKDGAFSLKVSITTTTLTVIYIGYSAQTITIKPNSTENVFVELKMKGEIMGELVISRPSLIDRIYYHLIKRPISKIF